MTNTKIETLDRPQESDLPQAVPPPSETLEKLSFEGIDPRFSDVAYHFTADTNLFNIERNGLWHANRIGEMDDGTIAAADRDLMAVKPADIPVDLERSVFGQIEQRHLGSKEGHALRTDIDRGESLSIAVDPHDTYVGDARVREELAAAPKYGTRWHGGNIPKIRESFWNNVMPLVTFKDLYEPVQASPGKDGDDYVSWQLKNPSNEEKLGLNNWIEFPELYIPLEAGEDVIPTARLAHTASSLIDL
jgi:hypothetical protein